MKRFIRLFVVSMAAIGLLLGSPGMAGADSGVAVITGTATTSNLGVPPVNGATGTWSISTNACVVAVPSCAALNASGTLHPVGHEVLGGGVGPGCGASSGHGSGSYGTHGLSNIHWVSSIGSLFPVTADVDGGGNVVALVQVSPSDPTACATGTANSFGVRIIAVLVH
jgi:hypothetical protein